MNLVTTRGCPYHCNWCAKPIYGQRYAVRSPEAVADEMAWIKRTYAPDHLAFMDDIFGLQPGWIARFAAAVAERDTVIPFKCLSRADLLSEEVVSALAAAGCRTVWIGAESGSQTGPRRHGKGDDGRGDPGLHRAPAPGGDRGRLLPPVRLSRRDLGGRARDAGSRA